MISKLLENEFYKGAYHTIILLVILSFLSFISYIILTKGLKVRTDRRKLKTRVIYVSSMLFIFSCAKIWVEGFTHLFYGISLVSAGLVVTNKESIMNIVGWGIISWRGLFSEGDFIEISGYSGVVYELGVLYFKLLEASPEHPDRSTGKFLKIPNGTVINNVVKRFSMDRHSIEHQIQFYVPLNTDIKSLKLSLRSIVDEEILNIQTQKTQAMIRLKREEEMIKHYVFQPPEILSAFSLDKPEYLKITISYHTRVRNCNALEERIRERLLLLLHAMQSKSSKTVPATSLCP